MPDRAFTEPRLAQLYDVFHPDRRDLKVYVDLVAELGASTVLDIGCGTGTFALMLAARGVEVVGLDPAGASLDVARSKPGATEVTWVHGDCSQLAALQVDVVTMTANVAQVFVSDAEWDATLRAAWRTLRSGGHLVFETRDPDAKAWRSWTRPETYQRVDVDGVGSVESWIELTDVDLSTVSFRGTCVFEGDGTTLTSASTLRFRGRDEVAASLLAAGFDEPEIRDAPDRPGLELVFIARRGGGP